MVWTFLNLFFTKKTAVQTAQLHNSSAMQRLKTDSRVIWNRLTLTYLFIHLDVFDDLILLSEFYFFFF